jgi:hypothetical protein
MNIYTLIDSPGAMECFKSKYPPDSYKAIPLDTKSIDEITISIERGNVIFCDGMNCLIILRILTYNPDFFSKVILYEPAGAFWWKDKRFDVRKDFHTLDFFQWIESSLEIFSQNPVILSAWNAILLHADVTVKLLKGEPFKGHDEDGWIELARLNGIKLSIERANTLRAKGNAYVRNLSCEIEWEEEDRENPGLWKKFNSIISSLGWQWESHWNVYTEDAPFGLMLSMLAEHLQKCIEKFHYIHSYIEWEWDGINFYISKIAPAGGHAFHRCLISQGTKKLLLMEDAYIYDYVRVIVSHSIGTVYSSWDTSALKDNEPFMIYHNNTPCLNADLILSRYNNTGFPGKCGSSPLIKFKLIKFIRSFPVFFKIYRSKKYFKDLENDFYRFRSVLNKRSINEPELLNLFQRYYLYIMRGRLVYFSLLKFLPGMRANYEKRYKKFESEHLILSNEFIRKLSAFNPEWKQKMSYNKLKAFWQDTGKSVK